MRLKKIIASNCSYIHSFKLSEFPYIYVLDMHNDAVVIFLNYKFYIALVAWLMINIEYAGLEIPVDMCMQSCCGFQAK